MKGLLLNLGAVGLLAAACSGIQRVTETPQLGITTSGAPTQPAPVAQASATRAAPTEAPTATEVPPTPTIGLPEGTILLPTAARSGTQPPPNTPVPVFPPGALEATLTSQPPALPDVATYNAAFQRYEHGAMLWIAETRQIYMMIEQQGRRGGPFYRFDDLFVDGDPEEVADLPVPPGLLQPHRGFGRIWREQPGLRAQIGWAADYEVPFTMRAARVTSGAFDATGNFVPNGEIWMMTLYDNSTLYLNGVTNTWGISSNQ